MDMDTSTWVLIAIAAVVLVMIILIVALTVTDRRRRKALREQFGPEYDRTVEQADKRRAGERELRERVDLRNHVQIRPLSPAARDRYAQQWQDAQTGFVDRPALVVEQADVLVTAVMRERGYPVDDWEQQSAMVSVDHPQIVDDYRVAHDVSQRSGAGQASTEDLREAFLRYRSLFDALLDTCDGDTADDRDGQAFDRTQRTV
jgi:hypothetical protein